MMGLIIAAGGESLDIMRHISDQKLWQVTGDFWITKQMLVMSAVCFVFAVACIIAARRTALVPRGAVNLLEPVLIFIRDQVVYSAMSPKHGEKLLPFFWTLFFFILINNLVGLIPGSATPTSNIAVTAALSLLAFILITGLGVLHHGPIGYLKKLVPEVPKPLWPFFLLIEVIGVFTKHFALAVRLLANMLAGHLVILAFMSMIFIFKNWLVSGVVTGAIVALSGMEVFIAFLQAYIFTFLTAIFLSAAVEGH
jgi:F-type H+-transporting ATPase subunit a